MARRDAAADRAAAVQWARELVFAAGRDPRSWVILDTETTGLHDCEVVELACLWPDGRVALDTLVCPALELLQLTEIPEGAQRVHGLKMADLLGSPSFEDLMPGLGEILHGRRVIVYNAAYDYSVLHSCLYRRFWVAAGLPLPPFPVGGLGEDVDCKQQAYDWLNRAGAWECAMKQYAPYAGEWSEKRGQYRWQKLPGAAHGALADCQCVLQLIRQMARG